MSVNWERVRRRMCTRKRKFSRKNQALAAAPSQGMRAYECLFCRWWHLTKAAPRQFPSEWIAGRFT